MVEQENRPTKAMSISVQTQPLPTQPIPKKSRTIKTDKPRPFLCPICTRGFVRQEHLKRHERSHTREKPFLCIFCGRCFARKDLVLRHQHKLHPSIVSKESSSDQGIIKIKGNKETVLPTPLNPSGELIPRKKSHKVKHDNEYSNDENNDDNDNSTNNNNSKFMDHRQRRHASFSAASAYTYIPDTLMNNKVITTPTATTTPSTIDDDGSDEVPHQVGFSTPQLSAQQVLDKALESGLLDMDPLALPPNVNEDNVTKQAPQTRKASMAQNYLMLSSLPSFTDMLTIGSSAGGSGGFSRKNSSSKLNLQSFNHTPVESNLAIDEIKKDDQNLVSSIDSDKWLSKFLNESTGQHRSSGNGTDFHLAVENFNDIGFYDKTASTSSGSSPSSLHKGEFELLKLPSIETSAPASPKYNKKQSKMLNHSIDHDISGYFNSRQMDIYKFEHPELFNINENGNGNGNGLAQQESSTDQGFLTIDFKAHMFDNLLKESEEDARSNSNNNNDSLGRDFFDESLRDFILQDNNLKENTFPTVSELNEYVRLYHRNFHKYFPFIHLYSLDPNQNTYPLLLAITMIGGLYGFHSNHSKILSIVVSIKLKKNLESAKNNKYTPLWLIQTMVLLTFLGVFSNDSSVTRQLNTQLMTLIQLITSNKLNFPLENILQPPIKKNKMLKYRNNPEAMESIKAEYNSNEQLNKNFDYFILAQSRIRTCHMVLLLSNLFTSLVGLQCCFHSIDLKCGIPVIYEDLFESRDYQNWAILLKEKNLVIDSKFSLIQLSNGGESYESCLMYLSNGNNYFLENNNVSKLTMLSLIMSIHEKIFIERNNILTSNLTASKQEIDEKWNTEARPQIDAMLKYWENLYIKTGGILEVTTPSIPLIDADPTTRLIIPMYLLAKIRKCLDLTYVMNKIWVKDWRGMNHVLDAVCYDWHALQEATECAISVVHSWISILSIVKNIDKHHYNGQTGYRTPIFTITCIFSSVLIISEYLKKVEEWALKPDKAPLDPSDKTLYFQATKTLKKIQTVLLPKSEDMKKYVEFMRLQNQRPLVSVDQFDNENQLVKAISYDAPIEFTAATISSLNLSSRGLYLGVRILGDAPIWPIAMVFAHALQNRAIFNVSMGTNV